MRDLDFDLSRSLQVKSNAAIWKSIHDFLFNFNGNYGPICKRFQVTALRNMRDLDLTSPGHSRSKPMPPFERASMTSYSTLMVNMDLSASVSKLQPSEICVTSILTSPGHSRSKPMPPFERASMTSYSTLMVTMDLSASFSKLQPLKYAWNVLDLDLTSQGHSRLKPMTSFARACMTSYSTLIVSMRLSVTVWKIQPFENTWPNGDIGHRSTGEIRK